MLRLRSLMRRLDELLEGGCFSVTGWRRKSIFPADSAFTSTRPEMSAMGDQSRETFCATTHSPSPSRTERRLR